ncbi:MAG: glucuronate isomerase [Lachnospiraceae bacterium]|nr:glucuronate isomerase [Lachnospiraceae bacterium]
MKSFMGRNFLLMNDTAKELYHEVAADLPIIDYHCHISAQEIWEDKKFRNLTEVWLGGDHYKWRIMRANGVEEQYITGDAPDYEKFKKFAETLPYAVGNPLYHWSHLELRRYFGYEGVLSAETADTVWELANERLKSDMMSARNIIRRSNVEVVCTTDDPADSLEYHEQIAKDRTVDFRVLPAWRPDKAMNIELPGFSDYMDRLGDAARVNINDWKSLMKALEKRLAFFVSLGCFATDHGIDYVPYEPADEKTVDQILKKVLAGSAPDAREVRIYKTALLLALGRMYAKQGLVMQLHFGAKRNNSSVMFEKLGPDTGYDSIGSAVPYAELADFLNALDQTSELPKTIVYSLHPGDNAEIETILGCFQGGGVVGKMQHGSAWWFNDHKNGMRAQLESFAAEGVLGTFIGMLTDSRSFLSYTRHEYFRRILCNYIGELVENGEYPYDERMLEKLVENICYYNAKRYFGL